MNFQQPLLLFWKIGEVVFKRENVHENSVSKYSNFFSYRYGMSDTFSIRNIKYMKKFYSCFPIYIKELDKLSFEHYKLLVDVSDVTRRYFYFRVAMFCRSSVFELKHIISSDLYSYL